jgi:predicted AAA+ superfamily ATPase
MAKTHIPRTLAGSIRKASQHFGAVLLTGPRQVGKTTLLETLEHSTRSYVTLDHLGVRAAAKEDPAAFIERLELPVLIDEVQYAPELFPYIKIAVDKAGQPGLFWLTGSQHFEMMKNVTESLAGRVGIRKLQGISLAEETGRPDSPPYVPSLALHRERQKVATPLSIGDVYQRIWRGSYPAMIGADASIWADFYESYLSTYIQQDIRTYLDVASIEDFYKFMQVAAARTGQLVNYADMAQDVGIKETVIKAWLNALKASGIITLLEPYFTNQTKRVIKTPKLYFMDTGLCAYLTRWTSPETLESGAMAGAMLETWVVSEIIKSFWHNGQAAPLYFYRDKEKREIDMLLDQNGTLHPIEIKKTVNPDKSMLKNFEVLEKLSKPVGYGALLCFTPALLPLAKDVDAVPVWMV